MLFLRYYLWLAPHILLIAFFVVFLSKKLHRQFPSLASYISIELARFVVSVIYSLRPSFPINAFRWGVLVLGGGLATLTELWVIYELWNKLVFSRSSLAYMGRLLLSGALAILLLGAAGSSGMLSHINIDQALNLFQIVDFSSSLMVAGLLLTLFVFSRALRISWRSWMVGIAFGLGISACVDLSTAAWRASIGHVALIPVDIAQMAAFHLCVIIWLVYLFIPEGGYGFTDTGLQKTDLDSWNDQLQKIIR